MQDSIWRKWNRTFDRIHLQDTELKAGGASVFINPAVKLAVGWAVFLIAALLFLLIGKPFSAASYVPFERNQYPEINSFVENYQKAYTNCDLMVLSTMVMDPEQFNETELQKRRELVQGYSNFDCYTKPGLEKGSYVVYAVMNTQIAGVSIQPLSLHRYYLIPNEYGGFLLDNRSESNPQLDAYLDRIAQDPDVEELVDRVNQNNMESAQSDEALRAFYEKIGVSIE